MKYRHLFPMLFVFLLLASQLGLSQTASAMGSADGKVSNEVGTSKPTLASSQSAGTDPFNTAYNYVVTFYPRWFTYLQAAHLNRLLGPERISPIYHAVVAINDDTLYASAFVSVTDQNPVIVTVPTTTDSYSVLQLDEYGSVFTGIPKQAGVYGLTGPGWSGTLPDGVMQIPVPYNNTVLIFRADKYVNGQDMRQEGENFRRHLHLATLSDYEADPEAGPARILPEVAFAAAYKNLAVTLIANQPTWFLRIMQTAVLAPTTQPLTPDEQTLSDTFNSFFSNPSNWPQMAAGAQAAHADIDDNYLTHTLPGTDWVNFTDMGEWDQTFQGYLNRAGISDYLQFGNNLKAAAYYHAFMDGNGNPLDGSSHSYTLTFLKGQQPKVSRFWSLTAYLPVSIELVPNPAHKYVVASYTPGLVTAPDGSVTIVMSVTKPQGVPEANWLPIPRGPCNVMLRAYGPEESNIYIPPPIELLH
jgi:hypothetical protein